MVQEAVLRIQEGHTFNFDVNMSSNDAKKIEEHTIRKSSKSRAASFFIAETSVANLRIVSLPKVDILR